MITGAYFALLVVCQVDQGALLRLSNSFAEFDPHLDYRTPEFLDLDDEPIEFLGVPLDLLKDDGGPINLVTFFSEGPPMDHGLSLSDNVGPLLEAAKMHFNRIEIYTPSRMKELSLDFYVKERAAGLVRKNPGMSMIGNSAWKPKIILLELEKMNAGEILIYRDANIKKYPVLRKYDGIRKIAQKVLDVVGFDFFVSREKRELKLRQLTKTSIIRELGEDHPFTYDFPNLIANFIVVRKSNASLEFLHAWDAAVRKEEWINGEQYGKLDRNFMWSCSEQSILGVLMANWVRKKKHNISRYYPKIGFGSRDVTKMFQYDETTDYGYLKLLKD